jgi:hypothetical protein
MEENKHWSSPRKGRKPKFEKSSVHQIRIPDTLWQQIPQQKRGHFVTEAIREKLSRECK